MKSLSKLLNESMCERCREFKKSRLNESNGERVNTPADLISKDLIREVKKHADVKEVLKRIETIRDLFTPYIGKTIDDREMRKLVHDAADAIGQDCGADSEYWNGEYEWFMQLRIGDECDLEDNLGLEIIMRFKEVSRNQYTLLPFDIMYEDE